MSRELPALRAREVVRALEKAGFPRWRQKGSHLTMFREADRRALTIPLHFSKTVPTCDSAPRTRQASAGLSHLSTRVATLRPAKTAKVFARRAQIPGRVSGSPDKTCLQCQIEASD